MIKEWLLRRQIRRLLADERRRQRTVREACRRASAAQARALGLNKNLTGPAPEGRYTGRLAPDPGESRQTISGLWDEGGDSWEDRLRATMSRMDDLILQSSPTIGLSEPSFSSLTSCESSTNSAAESYPSNSESCANSDDGGGSFSGAGASGDW